jgi:hypothetical protein
MEARSVAAGKTLSRIVKIQVVVGIVALCVTVVAAIQLVPLTEKKRHLEVDVQSLEKWKDHLVNTLSTTIDKCSPGVEATRQVKAAENAKYSVGFFGFRVTAAEYDHAHALLKKDGYAITLTALLERRPSWLANKSSVFYYDEASGAKARSIAEVLSRSTGTEFAVARGAGLAVVPGQERWSFFVHYVGG